MWLFGLFLAVPIIEIALFIQVGGLIGLWPTLGIVVLSAIIGTAIMRSQGAHAWQEVQRSFSELRDPSRPLAHGVMILIAGMLLLTPGFFTDALGLLLLVPPVREAIMNRLSKHIHVSRVASGGSRHGKNESYRPPYADGVIDGEYIVEDENPRPTPAPPDVDIPEDGHSRKSGWTRH